MVKGGGGKQASIASFFSKKPGAGATEARSKATDATPSSPGEPAAPPAASRKRLKRSIEDSPVKEAPVQAASQQEPTAAPAPAPALAPLAAPSSPLLPDNDVAAPPKLPSPAVPQAAASSLFKAAAAKPTAKAGGGAKAAGSSGKHEGAAAASPAGKGADASKANGGGGGSGGGSKASKEAQPPARQHEGEAEEEDEISFTASEATDSGSEEGTRVGEAQSDVPLVGVKLLKAREDTSGPRSKKAKKAGGKAGASMVEGVGSGALEAALRACEADVAALCTWSPGVPVPYAFLADTLEAIAEQSKRLVITSILTNCFRAILHTTPEDLLPTVYMCVNRVAPAHHGIELGVGESILIKALAKSSGRSEAAIKQDYTSAGDLGKLAVSARSTQRTMFQPKPNTIRSVFQVFKDIAASSGSSSQDRKVDLVIKLLVAGKGNEPGYIMRSLQSKLRIGLAEQSVLMALAHAVLLHHEGIGKGKVDGGVSLAEQLEKAAQAVKAAYSECPSYDVLVPALLQHGLWELDKHCHFMPSVPVKPMLAKATNGVAEVLEKFAGRDFTCEYKYDGERAQVHVMGAGKEIMIFSRNSENMTSKYPDIKARIPGLLAPDIMSLVLDGEAVAWDPVAKKILPFQVLSTRKRKDVSIADIKVQVVVFAFDCLYLNGKSLLQAPLTERRQALYSAVQEKEGELQFALTKTSNDVEELELFLSEAVDAATEGLIVKTLNDTYEPAKRSSHWLKLKKDYMDGVGDTFDVVPIGAFHGKGKRTGVYGAYLLAIYDPDTEQYQTISKLGTGFSEEDLARHAESLRPHVIMQPAKYYVWSDQLQPDVWFEPVKVWEVKAADLSISPVHRAAAGLVDPSKGISIRFPRLIRVRNDKGPEDSTSPEQVADMYRKQAVVRSKAKPEADGDDE